MQNILQLHTSGLLNDVDYQTWLAFTVAQLKTPGGQVCWSHHAVSLTPTIVEVIEKYIKGHPKAQTLIELYPQIYGENRYRVPKDGLNA